MFEPAPPIAPPSSICKHIADASLKRRFLANIFCEFRIPKPITAFASHYTGDMATLAQTISNDIHVKNPDVKYACLPA